MKKRSFILVAALLTGLIACDNTETVEKEPVKAETVRDLPADPITGVDASGRPASAGKYTYFSFNNGIIPATDSASNRWDLAFRATTILVNGGTSGPGTAGAVLLDGIFDEISTLPATAQIRQDQGADLAIPTGSGKGWYSYNPANNLIVPIAGKVLIVKTTEGNYAKVEILSYYKGAPATVNTATDEARYYTFRYVLQPDGTANFE